MGNLKRVQMLIEPQQHQALVKIARRENLNVAEITRRVIEMGLQIMEQEIVNHAQSMRINWVHWMEVPD